MRRLTTSTILATLMVFGAIAIAGAETWPSKPIKAIIPFGAGSATDVVPRIVFEQLSQQLGQQIIIENRPGAGGTIGSSAVAKSDPDGYTLLVHSSAHSITPALYGNLNYSTSDDFAAVGPMGNVPNVLIIAPSKGLTNVQDFVKKAKANPGTFNFASLGVGSAVYLSAERFRVSAGYDAVHIPFKGGPEALTEIISGRVDYYFCPLATALPFIKDGKLLGLAVSSPKRAAALPDVPTTLESGFANSDYTFWIGVFAPAKTPRAIIDKLHAEMTKAINTPAVREKLAKLGVEPMVFTPQAFDAHVKKEIATYGEFAKVAGLKQN